MCATFSFYSYKNAAQINERKVFLFFLPAGVCVPNKMGREKVECLYCLKPGGRVLKHKFYELDMISATIEVSKVKTFEYARQERIATQSTFFCSRFPSVTQ